MQNKANERIAEVQHGLQHAMTDLGLIPIMGQQLGAPVIRFRTADGTQQSPVTVIVGGSAKKGGEPTWGDCVIEITDIRADRVGDNGWAYLWPFSRRKIKLPTDTAQSFEQIEQALRTHPLVAAWDAPLVTRNADFATAYEDIRYKVDEYGGSKISCERIDGVERYVFTDNRNRIWHIAYEEDEAVVTVDGTYAESFPAKDSVGLMVYLGEVMFDVPRPK